MQKTLFLLYLIYQIAQIAAITLWLEYGFGFDMMMAMPLGVVIALVPVFGIIVAIFAAINVWDMHWMVATSAYVLPGLFILTLAMLGEVADNRAAQNAPPNGTRKKPVKRKMKEDDF